MATMSTNTTSDSATDPRRVRGLVAYLKKNKIEKIDDLDATHPLVSGATILEIRMAMSDIKSSLSDDLSQTYKFWMGDADSFSINGSGSSSWIPVTEMRYKNLRHSILLPSRSAIVFSSIDCWLLHFFKPSRTSASFAVMSVVSKDPAEYFSRTTTLAETHIRKATVSQDPMDAMMDRRPILSAITERVHSIIVNRAMASPPVTSTDPKFQLLEYISRAIIV